MSDTFERAVREALANYYNYGWNDCTDGKQDEYWREDTPRIVAELLAILKEMDAVRSWGFKRKRTREDEEPI